MAGNSINGDLRNLADRNKRDERRSPICRQIISGEVISAK